MPRCACATVKCVKWVTVLMLRSDSSEPWNDEAMYISPPSIMKRRVGE